MAQKIKIKEKTAFVTGAASGIGRATALAFAQRGENVAVIDTQINEGEKTVELIKKAEGSAIFIKCDVSKPDQIRSAVSDTVKQFGRIDYAFNNAGVEGVEARTAECSLENWDYTLNINLRGVWLCMKYEIPQMLKQESGGLIVNCSSIAGLVGFEKLPAYVASKHGVIGLTKTAALEYAKSKLRINAVCPGVIDTPMVERLTRGEAQEAYSLTKSEPIGRMGKPEEIASAVLWLCSENASFVTGHSLIVDGGWTAQ